MGRSCDPRKRLPIVSKKYLFKRFCVERRAKKKKNDPAPPFAEIPILEQSRRQNEGLYKLASLDAHCLKTMRLKG